MCQFQHIKQKSLMKKAYFNVTETKYDLHCHEEF